jgi:hypothetical protein
MFSIPYALFYTGSHVLSKDIILLLLGTAFEKGRCKGFRMRYQAWSDGFIGGNCSSILDGIANLRGEREKLGTDEGHHSTSQSPLSLMLKAVRQTD